MREKKFTEGPWKLTEDIPPNIYGEYTETLTDGHQPMVAMTDINECPSCNNIFYGPEAMSEIEANANLIAAAPELLEAMERIVASHGDFVRGAENGFADGYPDIEWSQEIEDKCNIAIAKAYGE